MDEAAPVFNQVNLIVNDMTAMLEFYRLLGIDVATPREWPPATGASHAEFDRGGTRLEFDNVAMAQIWHAGWRKGAGAQIVLSFSLPSREAVNERYSELTGAGYTGLHEPHDAFWGARYAIVQDPEGNNVALMSPIDADKRFIPSVPTNNTPQ